MCTLHKLLVVCWMFMPPHQGTLDITHQMSARSVSAAQGCGLLCWTGTVAEAFEQEHGVVKPVGHVRRGASVGTCNTCCAQSNKQQGRRALNSASRRCPTSHLGDRIK